MGLWIEELTPYYGEPLFKALRMACRETFMPSIGWVLDKRKDIVAGLIRIQEHVERTEANSKRDVELKSRSQSADKAANAFFEAMRKKLGLTASDQPIGTIDVPSVRDEDISF